MVRKFMHRLSRCDDHIDRFLWCFPSQSFDNRVSRILSCRHGNSDWHLHKLTRKSTSCRRAYVASYYASVTTHLKRRQCLWRIRKTVLHFTLILNFQPQLRTSNSKLAIMKFTSHSISLLIVAAGSGVIALPTNKSEVVKVSQSNILSRAVEYKGG